MDGMLWEYWQFPLVVTAYTHTQPAGFCSGTQGIVQQHLQCHVFVQGVMSSRLTDHDFCVQMHCQAQQGSGYYSPFQPRAAFASTDYSGTNQEYSGMGTALLHE